MSNASLTTKTTPPPQQNSSEDETQQANEALQKLAESNPFKRHSREHNRKHNSFVNLDTYYKQLNRRSLDAEEEDTIFLNHGFLDAQRSLTNVRSDGLRDGVPVDRDKAADRSSAVLRGRERGGSEDGGEDCGDTGTGLGIGLELQESFGVFGREVREEERGRGRADHLSDEEAQSFIADLRAGRVEDGGDLDIFLFDEKAAMAQKSPMRGRRKSDCPSTPNFKQNSSVFDGNDFNSPSPSPPATPRLASSDSGSWNQPPKERKSLPVTTLPRVLPMRQISQTRSQSMSTERSNQNPTFDTWLADQERRRYQRLAKRTDGPKPTLAERICDRRKHPLPAIPTRQEGKAEWIAIGIDMQDFSSPGWRWGSRPEARIRALLSPTNSVPVTSTEFREPGHYFSHADIPILWDCGESVDSMGAEV